MADTRVHLELPADFKGQAIRPGEAGYDEGRAVINGMIDRRPALIVRPVIGLPTTVRWPVGSVITTCRLE